MDSVHLNNDEVNVMPGTGTKAEDSSQATEAPQEKPTLSQIAGREFDSGASMALLREKVCGLPYLARLGAVLLKDMFWIECQICFHRGVSSLMQDLAEDVLAHQPSDPQAKELLALYHTIQLIRQDPGQEQWRSAVDLWASSVPEVGAQAAETIEEPQAQEDSIAAPQEQEDTVVTTEDIQAEIGKAQDILGAAEGVAHRARANLEKLRGMAIDAAQATADDEEATADPQEQEALRRDVKQVQEPIRLLNAPYRKEVLQAALKQTEEVTDAADKLNAFEPRIRAIVDGLDLKTKTLIGVVQEIAAVHGESVGVDYGDDIMWRALYDTETIKRGFVDLTEDPDIQKLIEAYRLATIIRLKETCTYRGLDAPGESCEAEGDQEGQEAGQETDHTVKRSEEGPKIVAEREEIINVMRACSTPCFKWMQQILGISKDVLPQLIGKAYEDKDTMCRHIIKSSGFQEKVLGENKGGVQFNLEYSCKIIRDVLDVLEQCDNKQAVLDAAIARARDLDGKVDLLKASRDKIKDAYRSLDPQTLALLKIRNEFFDWSCEYENDFKWICDQYDNIDISEVLKDTECAPLIELCHSAEAINEVT